MVIYIHIYHIACSNEYIGEPILLKELEMNEEFELKRERGVRGVV